MSDFVQYLKEINITEPAVREEILNQIMYARNKDYVVIPPKIFSVEQICFSEREEFICISSIFFLADNFVICVEKNDNGNCTRIGCRLIEEDEVRYSSKFLLGLMRNITVEICTIKQNTPVFVRSQKIIEDLRDTFFESGQLFDSFSCCKNLIDISEEQQHQLLTRLFSAKGVVPIVKTTVLCNILAYCENDFGEQEIYRAQLIPFVEKFLVKLEKYNNERRQFELDAVWFLGKYITDNCKDITTEFVNNVKRYLFHLFSKVRLEEDEDLKLATVSTSCNSQS